MNDLYLIGNGFDLAHGLKTSYNDFLLWYLNSFLEQVWNTNYFEDDLMKIDRSGNGFNGQRDFFSISELISWLKQHDYNINYENEFFKKVVEDYLEYKWVDIEYEYYMVLVEIYKNLEKEASMFKDFHFSRVRPLNDCFDSIKKKLVEYLSTIEISHERTNEAICKILTEGNGPLKQDYAEKLFLYFNYTSTMELYYNEFIVHQGEIIYIHGKLNDPSNPIIFGYGDEMDPHYEKIENLNNNEFLKNIKSFGYFKTDNYQRVIRFVESGDFTVKILGHSCGLSDRILLNTIFEHPNCKAIKIYHYEKSPTENDYFEKTQEISRHFKSSGKGEMRMKIVPFDKYSKMPQNPKK